MREKVKPYIVSVLIALAVGGLSALLTRNNMSIYDTLNRPFLSPPMWLFPVVWGILFVLMGIGAALVYVAPESEERSGALKVYAFNLVINFFWTIIFFNLRAYLFAFVWLILLWMSIIVMVLRFKKVNKVSAYLQIPYLLWVTFAGYLTFMIWLLNK